MKSYTFHVSLPGHGRVWRKLELPSEATLEHLHLAIQDAYEFDNDHLYSFFMSNKAWDPATEYSLPEGADPWGDMFELADEDDESEEELEEAGELDAEAEETDLAPGEMPSSQDLRTMFTALKQNPELRDEFVQALTQQAGMPKFMVETMLSNIDDLFKDASDDEIDAILSMTDEAAGEEANDVRATTLESLGLRKGKKFMYLFDYGDEWRFQVRVDAINNKADPNAEYPILVESVGEAPQQYPDWDEEDDEEGNGDEEQT